MLTLQPPKIPWHVQALTLDYLVDWYMPVAGISQNVNWHKNHSNMHLKKLKKMTNLKQHSFTIFHMR